MVWDKVKKVSSESLKNDKLICHSHADVILQMTLRSSGSELSFNREGTCRRPYGLITKSLRLQCCSRCSLPKVLSNAAAQITEEARKEKTCCGVQKTERPLAVYTTINKNDTPTQALPRRHLELKDDLFKEYIWGAATSVSAF